MKKLTFEFTISNEGGVTFKTSHDNIAPEQVYACALIASRDRGQVLAKAMKRQGLSEFDVDRLFEQARDVAREFVGA